MVKTHLFQNTTRKTWIVKKGIKFFKFHEIIIISEKVS